MSSALHGDRLLRNPGLHSAHLPMHMHSAQQHSLRFCCQQQQQRRQRRASRGLCQSSANSQGPDQPLISRASRRTVLGGAGRSLVLQLVSWLTEEHAMRTVAQCSHSGCCSRPMHAFTQARRRVCSAVPHAGASNPALPAGHLSGQGAGAGMTGGHDSCGVHTSRFNIIIACPSAC